MMSECIVTEASKINFVEVKNKDARGKCTFGISFGYYGNKLWTKKDCNASFKVCFTPSKLNLI